MTGTVPAVLAGVGYAWGVRVLHSRGDRWPWHRTAAAWLAVLGLAAATSPPLATDGGPFALHAAQHLVLASAVPIALVVANPVLLALRTLPLRQRRLLLAVAHSRAARIALSPPVAVTLAVGGTWLYYLTGFYDVAESHPLLHLAVHAHMLLAGCLLTWCVVAPAPLPARTVPVRLLVLVVAAGSHDLLAKLMYAHGLPVGAGTADQLRAGAQLLYYGGDVAELLTAVLVLSGWYAREGRRLAHASRA
jgi:putative membrane protein